MRSVAILIRFCYANDYPEEARRWRFRWFQEQCLPRILAQKGGPEFDLWLWTNPAHDAELKAMSPRIQTFTVATERIALDTRHRWSRVRGLPRYPIQIRVDSDDLIGPRYVKRAVAALDTMKEPRAMVWFQPYKFDITTGDVYWCAPGRGARHYSDRKPSAFLAFRQKVDDPAYSWVYELGHTKLFRIADRVTSVGEGHCWAACHDHNDSTHIYPDTDRYIGKLAGYVRG